jgi:ATP-dependent RNA helicase DeaD
MKFTELDLKPQILRGLKDIGYEDLTPVQEVTFPLVLANRDLIARAETGSGKTAACAIPLVQSIDQSLNEIQALILVPTRELALQYVSAISDIAKHTKIAPFAVYGGFPIEIQTSKLAHGVHILVATPGRLIDLLYHSPLSLSEVRTFVLDEADEMLNMGFITDIEFVLSCLIHEHQTLLFSATMPTGIKHLAKKYLNDPLTIELNADKVAPSSLIHSFKQIDRKSHFELLVEFIEKEDPAQAIMFCNSRLNAIKLADKLKSKFKSVDLIHGGQEQSRRTSLFNRFRANKVKIMVATDIASRGLDFSHTTHVINYDFPRGKEAYTHRTGRTARMGRKGTALTFYSRQDLNDLKDLLRRNRIKPQWLGKEPDMDNLKKRPSGQYRSHGKRPNRQRASGGKRRR